MANKESWGRVLRDARIRAGFTRQREFVDSIYKRKGITLPLETLSRYENNRRMPQEREMILEILDVLVPQGGFHNSYEVNNWMELAGRGRLTPGEHQRLFPHEPAETLRQVDQAEWEKGYAQEVQYHQDQIYALKAQQKYLRTRFVPVTLRINQALNNDPRLLSKIEEKTYKDLKNILADYEGRVIIVLGEPGGGKTTLLRRLQWDVSHTALTSPAETLKPIPFFVSLNFYQNVQSPRQWLAEEWQMRYPHMPRFELLFADGRFLLLLDGLNEIPHPDKSELRRMTGQWRSFLQQSQAAGNAVVFSCRSLDYQASLSSENVPVIQVQVESLAIRQITDFLNSVITDEGGSLLNVLTYDLKHLELFSNPFYLRLLVEHLNVGELPQGKAALLTGFIRRVLYREIAEKLNFRFEPGLLLSEEDIQQILLNRWTNPYALPPDALIIEYLEKLAYHLQAGTGSQDSITVRLDEKTAKLMLSSDDSEILAAGIQLNLLHKDLATRTVSFTHQLFQEYFAARVLAHKPEPERALLGWKVRADDSVPDRETLIPGLEDVVADLAAHEPLPGLPTTGWEEAILLAASMSPNQDQFVSDLMPYHLTLAGQCASLPEVQIAAELVTALQQTLMARSQHPRADIRARISAAEALAELGDPRFAKVDGVHGIYLRSPMVTIPAGRYQIGDDSSSDERERPAYFVDLETFAMGAFPVTNAEYTCFVEAGGYLNEQWWQTETALNWQRGESATEAQKFQILDWWQRVQNMTAEMIKSRPNHTEERIEFLLNLKQMSTSKLEEFLDEMLPEGKKYIAPEYWADKRFNHPAQPVVGLTIYEAQAYCAWLSAQTGLKYSLPTEQEWEAAARGLEARKYAYGSTFDASRCNTVESHLRRTAPVGIYPNGKTPEGIYDLTGNVWEWTSSAFIPYPYFDQNEPIEKHRVPPVVRGGSWYFGQSQATTTFRGFERFHRGYRLNGIGFRLLCRK